jgi:signal transduction histidine kinase
MGSGRAFLWGAAILVLALAAVWLRANSGEVPWWAMSVSLVLPVMAVIVSRAYPSIALYGAAALSLVSVWFSIGLCVTAFMHGDRADRMRPALIAFGGTAAGGTLLVVLAGGTFREWLVLIATVMFAGLLPWLVGRYRRQRQELIQAGWLRAEMLEREREAMAEQVRLRERARIAQEMHDSLGHEISLIALRAGMLEVAPDLADSQRAAAQQLRRSAAAAIDRLHQIIDVLRDEGEGPPLHPVDESIDVLIERARSSGMRITVRYDGDAVRSPQLVDRAAYCVVREALTNAAKHAPGAPVTVRLARSDDRTLVTVANEPPAGAPPAERRRTGRGLIGMEERVRLVGGSLRVRSLTGGFEVHADLPHAASGVDVAPVGGRPATDVGQSESSRRLSHARRRLRRGLAAAIVVPFVCLVVVLVGLHNYTSFNAVLNSSDFERIQVGQRRADIDAMLPSRQVPGRPASEPTIPAGSTCEYYTDGNFLVRAHAYRLCFLDGRLVTKDVLSGNSD